MTLGLPHGIRLVESVASPTFFAVLVLPEIFAGRSAGPRPSMAIRRLIGALPQGGALAIAAHRATLDHVQTWPEFGRHGPVEFIQIPQSIDISVWAQDAFLGAESATSPLMLFPHEAFRPADAAAARLIAERLKIGVIRLDWSFQGGNVMVGSRSVLVGADSAIPSEELNGGGTLPIVEGELRTILVGLRAALPQRRVRLMNGAIGPFVEERFGHAGRYQPLFHIDGFVTFAGPAADGREVILVGDSRLANRIVGDKLPLVSTPEQSCASWPE